MIKPTYPTKLASFKKASQREDFSFISTEEDEFNLPVFDLPPVSFEDKMAGILSNFIGEDHKHQKLLALALMAAAGLFLTLGNSLVQYVYMINLKNAVHLPSFEVLFVRSLIQLFFTVMFMVYGKVHPYGGNKKNLPLLCLMGIVEAAAIVLVYLSLEKLPVGDATVIQFTAPIFTMLFSFIFTKVCCSWIDAIFGILSFGGVILIAKPSIIQHGANIYFHHHHNIHQNRNGTLVESHAKSSSDYIIGVGFALLAAVCLSWFYILNKINGKKIDVTLTIFYPSIFGIVIAPIAMGIKGDHVITSEINNLSWGLLFVVGFIAFIGLMFMAEALQLENPGAAVLIRNMDVIYAFIFQYIFMHHPPGLSALIGTLIILTCSSIIAINRICNFKNRCKKESDQGNDTEFLLVAGSEEDDNEKID